ncbi:hypothetical protein BHF72_0329 [Cloacibacterium normanense]|uniref:Uncharacterized protein n=1 Tax=Cloacibacterium normanense TaxID=237258 RepID=A0A1E5UC70_9FLAO|nr:hypothetical protein BHF72_0329 [Cloacibacterium normanense]
MIIEIFYKDTNPKNCFLSIFTKLYYKIKITTNQEFNLMNLIS